MGCVFADEIHAPLADSHSTDGRSVAGHVPYASVSDAAAAQTLTGVSAAKGWNLSGVACAMLVLQDDNARRWLHSPSGTATHDSTIAALWATAATCGEADRCRTTALDNLDQSRTLFGTLLQQAGAVGRIPRPRGHLLRLARLPSCRRRGRHPSRRACGAGRLVVSGGVA
jgi:cystathionine beta-lyase